MRTMCTSLTLANQQGDHFLARTMDFGTDFQARIMVMPRNRTVQGDAGTFTTQYGFVGAGRKLDHEMFTDGVNECGVGIGALYFPGHASYLEDTPADMLGLAPQDFVAWVLGNITSVADLRNKVGQIQLINVPAALINGVPPLHFIISDATGTTAVLEPEGGELHLIDDPVGVMTNSPNLSWHLQHLSTYSTLTNQERPTHALMDYTPPTQGPGTGAVGLPGDYTSMSRFVKTVFTKEYATPATDVPSTLNLLQDILNGVTIPKGVKIQEDGQSDYTQYRGYMNLTAHTYYMDLYENQILQKVALTDDLLDHLDEPVEYPMSRQVYVRDLTADQVSTEE